MALGQCEADTCGVHVFAVANPHAVIGVVYKVNLPIESPADSVDLSIDLVRFWFVCKVLLVCPTCT